MTIAISGPPTSLADAQVAQTAALLADPTRVAILWALSDGRRVPAGELARVARVRPSTASAHLARLRAGGVLVSERHGRHRYYRLASPAVARVLEALARLAPPAPARSPKEAHDAARVRLARTCYDHLAGRLGVSLTDALVSEGTLRQGGREYLVSETGIIRLRGLGIEVDDVMAAARRTRRAFSRACLDWSERRDHLAGALGAALLDGLLVLGWIERLRSTRAVRITNPGRRALRSRFGVVVE